MRITDVDRHVSHAYTYSKWDPKMGRMENFSYLECLRYDTTEVGAWLLSNFNCVQISSPSDIGELMRKVVEAMIDLAYSVRPEGGCTVFYERIQRIIICAFEEETDCVKFRMMAEMLDGDHIIQ